MVQRVLNIFVLFVLLISSSGCASACKQKEMELLGLKNQISAQEVLLERKDQEIESLREALNKTTEEKAAQGSLELGGKKVTGSLNMHPSIKQIQTALRNAGFDPGPVDGKMGKKTRQAVRSFQKAHGLKVDAKVGPKTWSALQEYLKK